MNPFIAIYHFIKTKLFNKYPLLTECYMFDDEEDNRYKEYYFKCKGNPPYAEMRKLRHNITVDIYEFCNKHGYDDIFYRCSIFIGRLHNEF